MTLSIWDLSPVKDTSRQEAQAETGRVYVEKIPSKVEKYALPKKSTEKRSTQKKKHPNTSRHFKPADDGPGTSAAFTVAFTWIALGWWALVGSPALATLLVLNFIGVLIGFLFVSGSIKPPRISRPRNAIGAIVAGVANAAAAAATGCALVAMVGLFLIVLILSSVIILSGGWVLLIVLGGVAFVGALITLLSD